MAKKGNLISTPMSDATMLGGPSKGYAPSNKAGAVKDFGYSRTISKSGVPEKQMENVKGVSDSSFNPSSKPPSTR